jgi:hypothetical protein
MHVSFALVHDGTALQIHCDEEGLNALIAKLQEALHAGHLHLRASADGKGLLDDRDPWGVPAIGEVIITTEGA